MLDDDVRPGDLLQGKSGRLYLVVCTEPSRAFGMYTKIKVLFVAGDDDVRFMWDVYNGGYKIVARCPQTVCVK